MNADVEVRCADCGSRDLYCRDCDSDGEPEPSDRKTHALLDPKVREDMARTRPQCPCEMVGHSGQWLLCTYHEGFAAGLASV